MVIKSRQDLTKRGMLPISDPTMNCRLDGVDTSRNLHTVLVGKLMNLAVMVETVRVPARRRILEKRDHMAPLGVWVVLINYVREPPHFNFFIASSPHF
jgi:hypothetical protein